MIYSYCLQCEKVNQNGCRRVNFQQPDCAKRFICLTQTLHSDSTRSQLQTRLLAVEARITAITKSTLNSQNIAGRDLQQQLASSQVLSVSLRRVEATATSNLRRLEEYLGQRIVQSQKRFAEVEEKLIGMMVQKEKVLRNMNFTLENQGHSIAALELWANTDHSQNQSLSLLEEALRSRLQASQRNHQLQLETLQERIDSLEQSRSTAAIARQRQNEQKMEDQNQWDRQIGTIKKQIAELGAKIQQRKEDKGQEKLSEKIIEDLSYKMHIQNTKILNLQSQTRQLARSFTQFKEERQRQKLKQDNSLSLKKQFEMVPSLRSERKYSESKKSEKEEVITPPKPLKETKPLPPRKAPLIPQPSYFEEPEIKDMRGGIRGLLQKSKEKDREQLSKNNSNSKKPLPPVRQDPLTKKKKEQPKPKPVEPEAVVYQIDEQGYLMDEQGNYLVGEDGEMIRLSQSEIQQYMMEDAQ